jgi:hypothetical protein
MVNSTPSSFAGVVIPGIQINPSTSSSTIYQKSLVEKHVDIVEYLKRLPSGVKASFIDIQRGS